MAPVLDDLLNDRRLTRLFSKEARHCALQLWILQIKSEQFIENRIVYGRLLPYNYSNSRWSFSNNDNYYPFARFRAQIIRLNLYVESVHCIELLQQLSAGRTVAQVSHDLNLGLSDRLKTKFGTTALVGNLIYRPVCYLLNRDAYDHDSRSSPHGGAGAFSASISQVDKGALFRFGDDYNATLTELVVKHLNADTGLDFGGADATRFGDIELLVFPSLDDSEQNLLNVSWTNSSRTLVARFNPKQLPHFTGFKFRLSITNDRQMIYASVATAERSTDDAFECKFEVDDQLRTRCDSTELEIFGFWDDQSSESMLCCRWRVQYVRELYLQGRVADQGISPVKFDWLEKTTRPNTSARVKAALTISDSAIVSADGKQTLGFRSIATSHPFLSDSIHRNQKGGSSCVGARATVRGGCNLWNGSGRSWENTNSTK